MRRTSGYSIWIATNSRSMEVKVTLPQAVPYAQSASRHHEEEGRARTAAYRWRCAVTNSASNDCVYIDTARLTSWRSGLPHVARPRESSNDANKDQRRG